MNSENKILVIRKLIIPVALLLMVGHATAYFVGVNPSSKDLGEVERGETYEVTFFLNTDFNQNVPLEPEIYTPPTDFFRNSKDVEIEDVSFEEVDSWISFRRDETLLSEGDGNNLATTEGKVTFFIEIPRDAESGHHWVRVNPNPQPERGSGGSTVNMAVSSFLLKFRVPGDPNHNLEVTRTRGLRAADNEARVEIDVENTGSVTTIIETGNLKILDGPSKRDGFTTGGIKIAPGETKTIRGPWTEDGDIQAGNYRLRGNIDYITGSAFLDETFDITSFIEIQDSNQSEGGIIPSTGDEPGEGLPLWLIIMVLVLIGAVMYSFEIDPLLIILGLGALGISIFIVLNGLPLFLLAVVLIVSVALFYYGWI